MLLALLGYILLLTTLLISGLFIFLYLFYMKKFRYWTERNVPHSTPHFPLGDLNNVEKSQVEGSIDLYNSSKHHKYFGFWTFFKPMLLINDLDIVKNIIVKDFMFFHDRGFHVDPENDPMSGHLFNMNGSEWRNLRVKLTPTFTSGKMKMMYPMMTACAAQLAEFLQQLADEERVIEVKDILASFTIDIISSCAFGIEANSINNPEAEFRKIGFKITRPKIWANLKNMFTFIAPSVTKKFKLRLNDREVEDFFLTAVKDTIDYRLQNNIKRNDFLQLLIELMSKGYIDDVDTRDITPDTKPFTLAQATAQALVFFVGGFETSATTLQFLLYELAKNKDIQEKLREEIDDKLKVNGQLTYDCVQEMPYLNKVVSETLRKYPPVFFLARECSKNYKVPDTDLVIEKDCTILISVVGIHHDSKYYPQPEVFDPERFSEEEKSKRHHYSYLPFGEGMRICIGNRFALSQIKCGITTLLSKYQFDVCDKTPDKIKPDMKSIVYTHEGGMCLKISNRKI